MASEWAYALAQGGAAAANAATKQLGDSMREDREIAEEGRKSDLRLKESARIAEINEQLRVKAEERKRQRDAQMGREISEGATGMLRSQDANAINETFLHPFRDVLRAAGAVSVMASYNEIDGVPSHASKWLLQDVLRKEWGFKGFVVSDYYAIWELGYRPDTHGHFVAKDKKEACKLAVEAGVNIELPGPDCYFAPGRTRAQRCAQGEAT